MIGLRASKGLGDAIRLRAAVLHLLARGKQIVVYTNFPQVFIDLPVTTRPLGEGDQHERLRHFSAALLRPATVDYFTRACRCAGIEESVELRMGWKVKNQALLDQIRRKSAGRKIFVYQTRKIPRNEEQELLRPNLDAYNKFIAGHGDYYKIKLGQPPYVENDASVPCDMDLFGKASIHDAFDIGTIGDLFFGEDCYVPLLGEVNDRRFVYMFSRRALKSETRVSNATPDRAIHKKHLGMAVYDES